MRCGRDDDEENMVLCDDCNSAIHYYCCGLRKLPGEKDPFVCPRCKEAKRSDRYVNSCARVSVWWSAPYNCRYEGEVQKVRVRPDGGRDYLVWYGADDEQWQTAEDLGLLDSSGVPTNHGGSGKAKDKHGNWLLEPDEAASSTLRAEDPLVLERVRVSLYHEGSKCVRRGRYHGHVLDVRREKPSKQQGGCYHDRVLHLVQYDAGDRHWHVLDEPRWEFRREDTKGQAPRQAAPLPKATPAGEARRADKGKLIRIQADTGDDHEGERRQKCRDVIERALESGTSIGPAGSSDAENALKRLASKAVEIEAAAYMAFDSADYAK